MTEIPVVDLGRGVADEVSLVLAAPGIADAFADVTEEYPAETRAFLANVRQRAGRRVKRISGNISRAIVDDVGIFDSDIGGLAVGRTRRYRL